MASSPLRALKITVRDSSPHNDASEKPPGSGVPVTPVAQRTRAAACGRYSCKRAGAEIRVHADRRVWAI